MNDKILLIFPTFGPLNGPYISIPTLSSYLNEKNIPNEAIDINIEFYKLFLTLDNIIKGKNHIKKRFIELNNMESLKFSEMYEYIVLYSEIIEMNAHKIKIDKVIKSKASYKEIQKSNIADFLIKLCSFAYYPEIIFTNPVFSIYSQFSSNSTQDILKNIEHKNYYSELISKVVKNIAKKYTGNLPGLIGISIVFYDQVLPAFQIANELKKINPDIHITLGGPFVSIYMRKISNKKIFTIIDSLILDEGEIPLETLYYQLKLKKPDLFKVPGLIYIDKNKIKSNPTPPIIDYNKSPAPDYTVFDLDNYLYQRKNIMIPFRFSKGCYWKKCTFCRTDLYFVQNYIKADNEDIYNKLKAVIKKTKSKKFLFTDESCHPSTMEYISKRLLKDKIKIGWIGHTRVDKNLTKDRCKLYKKAGCSTIQLGVESFNNKHLELMKKGITEKQIYKVINEIDGAIALRLYMIIGFPGETESDAKSNYKKVMELLNKRLIKYYYYSIFNIIYGSNIWNNQKKYGIKKINTYKNDDLLPNVTDFECCGMSRKLVNKLFAEFMENNFNKNIISKKMTHINAGLNFDINKIRNIFFDENDCTFMPLLKFIEKKDKIVSPIKAKYL